MLSPPPANVQLGWVSHAADHVRARRDGLDRPADASHRGRRVSGRFDGIGNLGFPGSAEYSLPSLLLRQHDAEQMSRTSSPDSLPAFAHPWRCGPPIVKEGDTILPHRSQQRAGRAGHLEVI